LRSCNGAAGGVETNTRSPSLGGRGVTCEGGRRDAGGNVAQPQPHARR
jgi:hypothetical protein